MIDRARRNYLAMYSEIALDVAQVALGTMLGLATWFESNPVKQYGLAIQADAAFDQAIALDEWYWDAWMAKCELYGYSEEARWEREAIRMLETLIEAQEADTEKPAKYRKSIELLEELRKKHPQGKGD